MTCAEFSAIRFGVFLQGRTLRHWEWQSIERLRAAGAECLYIFSPAEMPTRQPAIVQVMDRWVQSIAGLADQSHGKIEELDPQRHQPSTILALDSTEEGAPAISEVQRQQVLDQGLKFVLFFGMEVPRGLPACAELGVWRFTRASGAGKDYPFVDGLRQRHDVVSFGLEQVTEDERPNRTLLTGHFRARGERNRAVTAQILSEASGWPLRVLKHVVLNCGLPPMLESSCRHPPRSDVFTVLLSLVLRDVLVGLSSKLANYLVLETWTLGVGRMKFEALLAGAPLSQVRLLPRCELGRYIADPFILSTTPELTLLAEDYTDFGVGRISEVKVRDPFGTPQVGLRTCLQSAHHMSYPSLFCENGAVYCLPECHQSRASVLYRYDEGRLSPVADLIPGAATTDSTILFHEGLYWLFCGLADDNDQVNLHLFFSKELRGGWIPHPLNPVKTDIRSSRSAGPIIRHGGRLFRPAQDCSKSYGYGLSINRIDRLTVTCFEETVIFQIRPEMVARSCKGVHTLSFADDFMVIDAKFHLVGVEPVLVRALRRIERIRNRLPRSIKPRAPSHSS
ncbi:MAG: hypothetical protein JOY64_00515 [Alphaproteobacteria bacterium]|nr:hypothetical protein [Alphaproteobacteria bacterium]MBV8406086.1 hypothetical protein [Alphaproteobacteria bacterium]